MYTCDDEDECAGDDADAGTGENADAKANAFALAEFDLGGEGVGVGWRPCGWAGAGAVAVGGCGEDFGVVCQGGGRRGEVGEHGLAADAIDERWLVVHRARLAGCERGGQGQRRRVVGQRRARR